MTGADEELAVLAVLRPASGHALDAPITAATRDRWAPDPAGARRVAEHLRAAGFTVGPLVGIAMSVAGPRRRLEEYFGTRVEPVGDGSWRTAGGSHELPLDALPEPVRGALAAVTFEPPAEAVW